MNRSVRLCDGDSEESVPLVVPVRGHLDAIRRMLWGDLYISLGSRQRNLPCSTCGNPYELSVHDRRTAIELFSQDLSRSANFKSQILSLSLSWGNGWSAIADLVKSATAMPSSQPFVKCTHSHSREEQQTCHRYFGSPRVPGPAQDGTRHRRRTFISGRRSSFEGFGLVRPRISSHGWKRVCAPRTQ